MSFVLLPGLGADRRLFELQKKAFPELVVPGWLSPRPRETLAAYAKRLSEDAAYSAPLYLGGASFGGMVALEMAKHLRPKAVFLVGSCCSARAIPSHLRFVGSILRRSPMYAFNRAKSSKRLLSATLGPCGPEQAALAARMAADTPGEFLKWGLSATLSWQGCEDASVPVHQIHGDRDRLLPRRLASPDQVISGGGHLLTLTHPEQVNTFLAERMHGR
jgi:pimeloyl-ACP methyl ester carboxylesterase